ncbi:hypothetical protein OIO90_006620 [Microbotryomycetes sp. JL221]|nr:hypothetical protein OIO90_006620 [Microbotryomycetes sp. JL221]
MTAANGAANSPSHVARWWKEGVVYQIYPASFQDSTGTGVGDIRGIIQRLDHIKNLGASIVWVCPIFKSPQVDLGYDISDYHDIHEAYGSVKVVEQLIKEVHDRGMKIIFDLVINHTSNLHAWFQESRSDKTNPKRDWYYWRPPRYIDGERHPPCNWRSAFGGSVWEWDEHTQEYYLHFFCPEQPDLNWENEEVRQTLYSEVIRYWLDKGIDGWRIDTANMYSKRLEFADAPIVDARAQWQPAPEFFSNGPRLHEFLMEMHDQCFSKYDCVTIGELPHTPDLADILSFVSEEARQMNMVIQFDLADLDHNHGRFPLLLEPWTLQEWKRITADSQAIANPINKAWVTTYLENHDQARSVSRFGSEATSELRETSAKMLATYLLTLTGTPIIYQGEEIGMVNCPKSWKIEDDYKDVNTLNQWRELQEAARAQNEPELLAHGLNSLQTTARDHARTPMHWDSSPQAGFSSTSDTWMRTMDSYKEINVASQENDPHSVLNYYRQMLKLRQKYKDVFVYGHFELLEPTNVSTMSFLKRSTHSDLRVAYVALNFTEQPQALVLPSGVAFDGLKLRTSNVRGASTWGSTLAPFEARVYLAD